MYTGNVHVLAFGTDWNVCGILFFLNYEKNYLTRDNIEENVPADNLHTGRWKTSIEKITRQGYDKHMTTSKKNRFLSIIKYKDARIVGVQSTEQSVRHFLTLTSYKYESINMKESDTRERS